MQTTHAYPTFKSIKLRTERTDLELSVSNLMLWPLTVFIGPNASGKSLTARTVMTILNQLSKGGQYYASLLKYDVAGEVIVCLESCEFWFRLGTGPVYINVSYHSCTQYPEFDTFYVPDVGDILLYVLSGRYSDVPAGSEISIFFESLNKLSDGLPMGEIVDTYREIEEFVSKKLSKSVSDVLPLRFEIRASTDKVEHARESFMWEIVDLRRIFKGLEIDVASSGISSAIVLLCLVAAYLRSLRSDRPVLLVVEEPELHAHQLQAVSLGTISAYLVERSWSTDEGAPLYVLFTTHIPEVLRGCLCTSLSEVYVFRREGNVMTASPWDVSGVMPGFTEAAIQAVISSSPGIEAIRRRRISARA